MMRNCDEEAVRHIAAASKKHSADLGRKIASILFVILTVVLGLFLTVSVADVREPERITTYHLCGTQKKQSDCCIDPLVCTSSKDDHPSCNQPSLLFSKKYHLSRNTVFIEDKIPCFYVQSSINFLFRASGDLCDSEVGFKLSELKGSVWGRPKKVSPTRIPGNGSECAWLFKNYHRGLTHIYLSLGEDKVPYGPLSESEEMTCTHKVTTEDDKKCNAYQTHCKDSSGMTKCLCSPFVSYIREIGEEGIMGCQEIVTDCCRWDADKKEYYKKNSCKAETDCCQKTHTFRIAKEN